jgi:hypothetical protein
VSYARRKPRLASATANATAGVARWARDAKTAKDYAPFLIPLRLGHFKIA